VLSYLIKNIIGMRKVYAIGESLLDIIFKNGQPQAAKAGGSMLNTAVSLGRLGLPVYFISEYGLDDTGNLIDGILRSNGVNTSFSDRFRNGATALALAFLDDRNDANYSFYKCYPGQRLNTDLPVLGKNDLLLYGSFYAISGEIRDKFMGLIKESTKNGSFLIYDPNFRSSHLHELDKVKPFIMENIMHASLVRGSDEDFRNIFGAANAGEAWEAVKEFCKCLVYTANDEGVTVKTGSFTGKFPVRKITPLSTIGAGDSFNAGMISAFYNKNIGISNLQRLGKSEWEYVISRSVEFATHVCMSYDNYISAEFAEKVK
jgi:fructokinase